jgi:hypothetical protein
MSSIEEYERQRTLQIQADGRMLKWLRREMNRDLRAARASGDADRVAICKALLDVQSRAASWQGTRNDPYYARIQQDADLVLALARRLAWGFRFREGYKWVAWEPR